MLTIPCEEGGDTGLATAKSVLSPVYAAAQVLDSFGENHFGEHYSFMASIKTLTEKAELVKAGKMDEAEAMLFAQASALNLLFADLSRRAANNLGSYFDAGERYLRLALKAQSQARMTLESLSNIKNPPVVYAKQANIAHGPQQVNNGAGPSRAEKNSNSPNKLLEQTNEIPMDTGAPETAGGSHGPQQVNNGAGPSRAEKNSNSPNKLLEQTNEIPMDTGAPETAGGSNSAMEAVGKIDWAANR